LQQRQGRADCCTCRQKASCWSVDVPHQAWSRRSTGLSPGGQRLASLCCELLQRTHRSQRPCAGSHTSEAVFDPHQNKAQHCRCSSLGTGRQDLSVPTSRCQLKALGHSSRPLNKHTESLPLLDGWTCGTMYDSLCTVLTQSHSILPNKGKWWTDWIFHVHLIS
jgi:hypothetical protein